MNDESRIKEISVLRRLIFQIGTHLCSHFGLVVLVFFYTLLGTLLFERIEGDSNVVVRSDRGTTIEKSREDCLKELWIITERLNVLYERNWTQLVHEQLRKLEVNIVRAATQTEGLERVLDEVLDSNSDLDSDSGSGQQWSFSTALIYSITVITTIGYGNLTPKTAGGKVLTMIYAAFGVPLMLLCLSSLGQLLAKVVHYTYQRLCGCCQNTTATAAAPSSSPQTSGQYSVYKYQRAPSSPIHDSTVIQLATTPRHRSPQQLATVNRSHTRGRCRLLSNRSVPLAVPIHVESSLITTSSSPHRHHQHKHEEPPDIEDADETDDTENGNYCHNTPSRIPLIMRSPTNNQRGGEEEDTEDNHHHHHHHHHHFYHQKERVSVPVLLVIIVLTSYLCIGAVLFTLWIENWTYLDAVYFCFVTLSTIGFGEVSEKLLFNGSNDNRTSGLNHLELVVCCCVYLLVGLVLIAMAFSLVHDEIVSRCKQLAKAIGCRQ